MGIKVHITCLQSVEADSGSEYCPFCFIDRMKKRVVFATTSYGSVQAVYDFNIICYCFLQYRICTYGSIVQKTKLLILFLFFVCNNVYV